MQANILSGHKMIQVNSSVPDWSYSRMQILYNCPRKYYYSYYGGKVYAAVDEPDKMLIQFLKTLSNAHTHVGEVVHKVIKTYFTNLKKGVHWDLTRLQGFGYRLLKDAVNYSVELRDDIFNTYRFTPLALQEVYYGEVNPSEFRNRLRLQINHHLEHFFNSSSFLHLREGAVMEGAKIETRTRFSLGSIKVDGVVDIMFPHGPQLWIADWKTGEREIEDTSLQLLTYAWWAINSKIANGEGIKIQKAYLNEGILEDLEFSNLHLQRAKARIIQDSERLAELEDFGKDGIIDAFTACGQEKICAQCSFKKICSKE